MWEVLYNLTTFTTPSHHTTCCDIRLFSEHHSALKASVFQGLCSCHFFHLFFLCGKLSLPSVLGKLLLILQGSPRIFTSSPEAFPSSLRVGYHLLRGTMFLSYLIKSLMLTSPSQLMYLGIWLKWTPEVFATHLTSIYPISGSSALTFRHHPIPSQSPVVLDHLSQTTCSLKRPDARWLYFLP